jgi:hypothetical protein
VKLTNINSTKLSELSTKANYPNAIPKLSEGKLILLIEKSQFGLNLTQEAIDVERKTFKNIIFILGNV